MLHLFNNTEIDITDACQHWFSPPPEICDLVPFRNLTYLNVSLNLQHSIQEMNGEQVKWSAAVTYKSLGQANEPIFDQVTPTLQFTKPSLQMDPYQAMQVYKYFNFRVYS